MSADERRRFVPLVPDRERVKLEPGRFGQVGDGIAFVWVATLWGGNLHAMQFHPKKLASPLLGWIVEALELDGAEQLVQATPLALLAAPPWAEALVRVPVGHTLRLVVRLGTLDEAAAPVGDVVATAAILEVDMR